MKMAKSIAAVLCSVTGGILLGEYLGKTIVKESLQKEKAGKEKFKNYYYMANHWLDLKQNNISIADYFINNNINSIAIYGMGEMGRCLIKELKNYNIDIKYVIDQNENLTIDDDIIVITPKSKFKKVDAIIVTATFAFDEIKKELEKKVFFPIISLGDVIYGV